LSTTVHDVIEKFRTSPGSNRERGEKFERLMVAYLKLDPLYAEKFSEVWMWSEWPGRAGKSDTGIDLVAQERESGEFCAIQCKFYEPQHHLQKADIDSFFTASGKQPFTSRIIISTTDKWGRNAEDAVDKQQIPVARIGLSDIALAPIDWDLAWPQPGVEVQLRRTTPKTLRPHQSTAVEKVFEGFETSDRGKLIMACGTGKTFTSLKIAEYTAQAKGAPTTVLYLVPSISLLSQTLREWTANCATSLRSFAVCSDTKVGKRSDSEDISVHDLALPATTNTDKLITQVNTTDADTELTVIFSTYQSIDVVAKAQAKGLPTFDLIICDEAHRTTGVTLVEADESSFVKVHDNSFIAATKRLYMTATPRLFDDNTKTKAEAASAVLASMDDETLFGPEFHRLGFGEAVEKNLLTDYKVLILTVDEKHIAKNMQAQVADENNEINLDDAVKIVGCWNGLAKRSGQTLDGTGFGKDLAPMRRAVAFSQSIKASKKLTAKFTEVIDSYHDAKDDVLRCEVEHVDGTYNALQRNHKLDWLKADAGQRVCRILSNARCLSEGVDVPDLDAVLFLNPRNSVVDVVQSVGRVMRRAEGKEYGYIILPVGIPSGMDPSEALRDNKRYKVVWQVLQALRAHDDRFNATINKIALNRNKPSNIMVGTVGLNGDGEDGSSSASQDAASQLALFNVEEWRDAIYAKIVTKVGERTYWEDWATDVAKIAGRHTDRITTLLENPDSNVGEAFDNFLLGLRNNLNDAITRADAIDMLAQHLITKPVFDALFEGYSFTEHNPVSQVMQTMLDALDDQALDKENETLERFYASVRLRAEGIDNAEGKQTIIKDLYERFFKLAFAKVSQSLGIVYTPVEIIDFILRSVNDTLKTEFGASLSDKGVHVLDPGFMRKSGVSRDTLTAAA
jgi:predicted helicase